MGRAGRAGGVGWAGRAGWEAVARAAAGWAAAGWAVAARAEAERAEAERAEAERRIVQARVLFLGGRACRWIPLSSASPHSFAIVLRCNLTSRCEVSSVGLIK